MVSEDARFFFCFLFGLVWFCGGFVGLVWVFVVVFCVHSALSCVFFFFLFLLWCVLVRFFFFFVTLYINSQISCKFY